MVLHHFYNCEHSRYVMTNVVDINLLNISNWLMGENVSTKIHTWFLASFIITFCDILGSLWIMLNNTKMIHKLLILFLFISAQQICCKEKSIWSWCSIHRCSEFCFNYHCHNRFYNVCPRQDIQQCQWVWWIVSRLKANKAKTKAKQSITSCTFSLFNILK